MRYKKLPVCILFIIILIALATMAGTGEDMKNATFAGGCFWCMEPPFRMVKGAADVKAGYMGGVKDNPTYEEVSSGTTGHREVVQVTYDPSKVSYDDLLNVFWQNIDPTDPVGQFADKGTQYRTAIFYHDPEQKASAERSREDLARSGKFTGLVVTEIIPAGRFYPAEEYHQQYYKKDPVRYGLYKEGSGRKSYLEKTWPAPAKGELKKKLTPLQYKVTQECGTEPPFKNEYWNNKREGIYVDVVSGEPLFSSSDKFDSGTGWPSFTRPVGDGALTEEADKRHGMARTEVKGAKSGSHLGHVFDDGPQPGGLRYCINSAALRFISKEDLEKEGYGEYRKLIEK